MWLELSTKYNSNYSHYTYTRSYATGCHVLLCYAMFCVSRCSNCVTVSSLLQAHFTLRYSWSSQLACAHPLLKLLSFSLFWHLGSNTFIDVRARHFVAHTLILNVNRIQGVINIELGGCYATVNSCVAAGNCVYINSIDTVLFNELTCISTFIHIYRFKYWNPTWKN